jgi:hypothetical protein
MVQIIALPAQKGEKRRGKRRKQCRTLRLAQCGNSAGKNHHHQKKIKKMLDIVKEVKIHYYFSYGKKEQTIIHANN